MLIVRAVDCEPRSKQQRAESGALRSFLASLRVKRFYALRDRNWLWAEGLRMRFHLHKRNRVFMLLLARRFLKVESPPGFHSAMACNARAEPQSTRAVIMHWLLNGCSAGRRATRRIRECISFSPTENCRLASRVFVRNDEDARDRKYEEILRKLLFLLQAYEPVK